MDRQAVNDPTIGIEVGPGTAGDWANVGRRHQRHFSDRVQKRRDPLRGVREIGFPAMWVNGTGLHGEEVVNVYRIDEQGNRHEIRAGGVVTLTHEKTYQDLLHFTPDGTQIDPLNTYQKVLTGYHPAQYQSIFHGASNMSKKFSVADIEAPFNENFHYEAIIRVGQVDPSNPDDPANFYTIRNQRILPLLADAARLHYRCPLLAHRSQLPTHHAEGAVGWTSPSIDLLTYPGRRELFDVIGRAYSGPVLSSSSDRPHDDASAGHARCASEKTS